MIEQYVDAQELRRLLSTLMVILGCLIVGGLFAALVLPGLRNANRPAVPAPVAPVVGETGWLDPAEFPPQKGSIVPPVDPKTLMTPSAELLDRGKKLYEGNCVSCHGAQGRGDGPAAQTMNPRPRNFADQGQWKNGRHMAGIFQTLKEGIADTSMASFDYLSRRNRMALVHYVQSLGSFAGAAGSAEAVDALSKELASAGEIIPNRIPVSMALNKLAEESAAVPPIRIDSSDSSPGADLVRRAIEDPVRAGQYLGRLPLWRVSYRDLAAGVALGIPENGFSAAAAKFSPDEWRMLHSELAKRARLK